MKSTVNRQPHTTDKEKTRSITYRLPAKIVEGLETEATQKNISQNVLVKQILEKYLQWDRFGDKIGMIPIPKGILDSLGKEMEGEDIEEIIEVILPMIKDTVLFMKGGYDLKRCIETLEDYMKMSGMKSDHRIEGNIHHFIIQHNLGIKWSLFTEALLKEIFHSFVPDKNLNFKTTSNTVVASIPLGSDFNEHDY
ncbi:MAG: hypothetical protein DWQ18_01185 [Crenarchaeota archaeon]|nr:MAG: hypothetical protein DWQ17_04030 [Thermoproteota archaeon]RDJ34579.1 MAG: hypothetical protein DWQ18_01185 [Thermoproteota archaeon]RDJ35901.1 MAG: hypothetical protein DWQ19_08400 [Thermoproteota archaeon]RDJ38478.1 MAG: hypothetical protein DWQ13_03635 [Thermoproteota archaeon]